MFVSSTGTRASVIVAVTSPAAGRKNDTVETPPDAEAKRELAELDGTGGAAGKNKDASWASSDSTVFFTEEAVPVVVALGAAVVFPAVDRKLGEAAATDASGAINVMKDSKQA
jgi:hypothetical protein